MKRYRTAVLGLVVAAGLTGCSGTKNTTADTDTSAPAVQYEVASGEEEYQAYVDMNMVLQTISMNGQPFAFPTALSGIGTGLYCNEWNTVETDGKLFYRGTLTDGAAVRTGVEMYKANPADEGMVYEIQVFADGGIPLSVNGITFGASYNQVVAAFGEPSSVNGNQNGRQNIYYENCSAELLAFTLENGAVSSIIIRYRPPELR